MAQYFPVDKDPWKLPTLVKITPSGRQIVEQDPNLNDDTLDLLYGTDWSLLTDDQKKAVSTMNFKELVEKYIDANNGLKRAHIAQCIKSNLKQPLAQVAAQYSMECRTSFLIAAIYLKAILYVGDLVYYQYSPGLHSSYRAIAWNPPYMYVPPPSLVPPGKNKRRMRTKHDSAPKQREYTMYDCPLCHRRAILLRTGPRGLQWHVCCTDPERKCPNFVSENLSPSKTRKIAVDNWNAYVKRTLREMEETTNTKSEIKLLLSVKHSEPARSIEKHVTKIGNLINTLPEDEISQEEEQVLLEAADS